MKKAVAALLALIVAAGLWGCAVTEESGYETALKALSEAETVLVHLYCDGEETLELEVTDELSSLIEGKWEKTSGRGGGEKELTITVGTQHEITFFDNGTAMIYYGFTSVIEKDRCYYSVALDGDFEELYDHCQENGTVPETEE